jgi:hypothetical protein
LFCNHKDAETYRAERLLAFKSSNDKSLALDIAAFNFPVFNSNYSKAVIIYLSVRHSWRKYDDGKPTSDLESVSIAFVYRKKKMVIGARRCGICLI